MYKRGLSKPGDGDYYEYYDELADILGLTGLFDIQDPIVVRHKKCDDFIIWYNTNGYPKGTKDDLTWYCYLAGIRSQYAVSNKKVGGTPLDTYMINKFKAAGVIIESQLLPVDYKRDCNELVNFMKLNNKVPCYTGDILGEQKLATKLARIREGKGRYKYVKNEINNYMSELGYPDLILNNGRAYMMIEKAKNITIKYPCLSDIVMKCTYTSRNKNDYCWLFQPKNTNNEGRSKVNAILSEHYRVKNFLNYSHKELKEIYDKCSAK